MPLAQRTAAVSLALSIGIVAVAGLLFFWLWSQRQTRDPDLPDADARHFARQDLRRASVSVVLLVLALIIFVGSPMEAKVAGRANLNFILIWLTAFLLIFMLLLLAAIDWFATRVYARRHFQQLARERLEILLEEQRRLRSLHGERNGTAALLDELPPS